MTTFYLNFWRFISLTLLCVGVTGCSTKVRLSSTGTALLPGAVDLGQMGLSYDKIKSGSATGADIAAYNCAVRGAVSQLVLRDCPPCANWQTLRTKAGTVDVCLNSSQIRCFDLVDKVLIADTIKVTDGIGKTIVSDGVGVPLLARIPRTKEDHLIPEEGLWVPVTAICEPSGKGATLRLIDTTVPQCGFPFPVASNFTAPLARDLHDRQKGFQDANALFNFDRFAPAMGINRVFGFHPDKTPVVFVHGVYSSSITWANAINELMADPEIRNRFEFWNFRFPTGAPIPFLADKLRDDLDAMYKFRKSCGATHPKVILVGHSMGGLMSKMVTQRSGERQWKRFFDVPPDQLNVSANERAVLRNMFYFEPLPYIDSVVFTATPHRGAEAADRNVVQFVGTMVKTPRVILDATRDILQAGVEGLTPHGWAFAKDFPNSIQHMEYGSEIGEVFADLPLNPSVKYYSIIGSKEGLDVPKEEMTDGVVAYKSAHIPGVVSEKIVESDHGVQRTEAGIAEISRILKLSR